MRQVIAEMYSDIFRAQIETEEDKFWKGWAKSDELITEFSGLPDFTTLSLADKTETTAIS